VLRERETEREFVCVERESGWGEGAERSEGSGSVERRRSVGVSRDLCVSARVWRCGGERRAQAEESESCVEE